ncbi:MAG TPA: hypothetical protein VHK65_02015 [Candidatus Dormibacteraeota bacterium]|nr:hypothetical protein [Candidatus Dormibacteraeota bacterium]
MSQSNPAHYTVSLIGVDGRTVAQATAANGDQKPVPFPGSAAGGSPSGMAAPTTQFIAYPRQSALPNAGVCCDAFLPTVSTSNARVYFPDGPTAVRYLGRDGSTGLATSMPSPTAKTRAVFSVSPDDQRIAIGVFDWSNVGPMISTVTVQDLRDGGHPVEVERTASLYGWPVGWHSGNLVVARMPAFAGAPNPNAATAYSLVNSSGGENLGYLGGMTCPVVGPLSRAGTACVAARCHCIMAADWSSVQNPTYTYADASEMNWAALSPSGHAVIFSEIYGPRTGAGIWRDGSVTIKSTYSSGPSQWLDETHAAFSCQGGGCYTIEDLVRGTTEQVRLPGEIAAVLPGGL